MRLGLAENKGKAVDLLAERYRIAKGTPSIQDVKPLAIQIKTYPEPQFTDDDKAALIASLKGGQPLIGSPGEEYLRGRGIDPDFAASCRVGYHPSWLGRGEAVVFLGRDLEGSLVCAQGRFLDLVAEPKTMSKGKISMGSFATPGALKNGPSAGPVALVEGPIDALLLAQEGLPSLATFGAQNHPIWLQEGLTGRDVVFALDDDEAGHKAEKWYREKISVGIKTCTTLLFDGEKDPGELVVKSPEKLTALVEEALRNASPHLEKPKDDGKNLLAYSMTVLGDDSLIVDSTPPTIIKPSLPTVTPPVLQKMQETPKTQNPWHGVYGKHGEHATREMIEQGISEEPTPPKKDLSAKEKAEQIKDMCGECGEVFIGKTAKESAKKLQSHVEDNPCAKYIALNTKTKEQKNECTFRCGGCGAKYETRKEIEEHVALSKAINKNQKVSR
jgi:hypothetical protein